jgi:hypothetical protein
MPAFDLLLWKLHCFGGAAAVTFGAFGAHGLKKRIADVKLLEVWDTAARYQFVHSLVGLAAVMYRAGGWSKGSGGGGGVVEDAVGDGTPELVILRRESENKYTQRL